MHEGMAATLDAMLAEMRSIQRRARDGQLTERPRWPMLILRTPKGWTGPKVVDGKPVEDTWRSHQVPISELHEKPEHLRVLEDWMRSYQPNELFDSEGRLKAELASSRAGGRRRMGMNPHANGGLLLEPLSLPDFRAYAVAVPHNGQPIAEATRILGHYLRDVMKLNHGTRNFRMFGPDETASNRLDAVLDVTGRHGRNRRYPSMNTWRRMDESWRSSANTCARAGWKGIC